MINHEFRFIFVHINKTAGTSIESVFIPMADQTDVDLKHATIGRHKKLFPDEFKTYFSFAFVRNPFDWLVSRYEWSSKKQGYIDYSFEEMVTRLHKGDRISYKTDFLDHGNSLRPQLARICIDYRIAVDFVGRFENLHADFDKVCDRIGHPKVRLAHHFKTERQHYSEYYTSDTRKMVEDLFNVDLKMFDYSFEGAG